MQASTTYRLIVARPRLSGASGPIGPSFQPDQQEPPRFGLRAATEPNVLQGLFDDCRSNPTPGYEWVAEGGDGATLRLACPPGQLIWVGCVAYGRQQAGCACSQAASLDHVAARCNGFELCHVVVKAQGGNPQCGPCSECANICASSGVP